jgi:hypothetical protein
VQASRDRDGLLHVRIWAETQSEGWRIYTNHLVQGDTLDVRIMGIPPSQYGVRRATRSEAAPICVEDRNSNIRRIVVHGQNGARYLTIGSGTTSAQSDRPFSSNQPADRPRPGSSAGSSTGIPLGTTTQVSQLATQAANQVEVLRYTLAAQFGQSVNPNGTTESLGGRSLTPTEQQLFENLFSLQNSARALPNSFNRQRAAQQLRTDTQNAAQQWERVRSSSGIVTSDLTNQWRNAQNSLLGLCDTASRG